MNNALIPADTGTVTIQASKMFLKKQMKYAN
jgi:hypothetical protein